MAAADELSPPSWLELADLSRLRALVRTPMYRRIWALSTFAYVVVSMFIGQMVEIFPQSTGLDNEPVTVSVFTSVSQVANVYELPAVLIVGPHFVVQFSLWPTLAMVAIGIGIGLSVAASTAMLVTQRRARSGTASTAVAPLVTGWALLGACCCTTCATQVAAVGVLGATEGASTASLIVSAWPLAFVQLLVLGLTLLYMEYRIRTPLRGVVEMPVPRSRSIPAFVVRLALLLGGITWMFAFVLEFSETPAAQIDAPLVYHWVFEHLLLGGFATMCGLAPEIVRSVASRHLRWRTPMRAGLLIAGISWGIYVPPALTSIGLGGFLNELFGYLGYPASWGAIPPDSPLGAALLFHWAFQHLVLSAWAIGIAVRPSILSVVTPGLVPAVDADVVRSPAGATNA